MDWRGNIYFFCLICDFRGSQDASHKQTKYAEGGWRHSPTAQI